MDVLFLLKKIIGIAIMPLSITLILLLLSILFFKSKPRFSFLTLLTSFSILLLSSMAPVSDFFMYKKERLFPAFTKQVHPVDYIVVLGCGHTTDIDISITSQLQACSLQRLVEAVRIYRLHPEAQVITSGGSFSDPNSNAQMVKAAAEALGIPSNKIIAENFPKDTEEEAQLIAPRIKGHTAVLITNADHIPRAVKYFNQYGANVIPAPASHFVKGQNIDKPWAHYTPSVAKLKQTTNLWYESVGEFVHWLKS